MLTAIRQLYQVVGTILMQLCNKIRTQNPSVLTIISENPIGMVLFTLMGNRPCLVMAKVTLLFKVRADC